MPRTNRAANSSAIAFAVTSAERKESGLVECAIFSFAGLAVALLLIGMLPAAMQTFLQ